MADKAEFKNGQKMEALYIDSMHTLTVGLGCVTEITVVMEHGQMAGVPWFVVWSHDKIISKWNAALVQGARPVSDPENS